MAMSPWLYILILFLFQTKTTNIPTYSVDLPILLISQSYCLFINKMMFENLYRLNFS